MKRPALALLLITIAATGFGLARAQDANKTNIFAPFEKPIIGMSVTDFSRSITEIIGQMPVGPKIIGVRVQDEDHITIQTGHVKGPLSGGGIDFIFEKAEGHWKKVNERSWVS